MYRIQAKNKAQEAFDIEVARKTQSVFEYASIELALQVFNDCESDWLVDVSTPSQNCCLFYCSFNALREFHKRVALVGGAEYARIPSQLFKTVCGPGIDGYQPYQFKKYLDHLRDVRKAIKSYRFKKCEGYKSDNQDLHYFHASRIFTNLRPGTILLFCGYSLPPKIAKKYKKIIVKKKAEYRKSGNNHTDIEIERYIEIFADREVHRVGSPLFELWLAFVHDTKEASRHVCAVSKDANDGVIYKYDNSHHKRKPIYGLEDLLPYTFFYTDTFVFDIEV